MQFNWAICVFTMASKDCWLLPDYLQPQTVSFFQLYPSGNSGISASHLLIKNSKTRCGIKLQVEYRDVQMRDRGEKQELMRGGTVSKRQNEQLLELQCHNFSLEWMEESQQRQYYSRR